MTRRRCEVQAASVAEKNGADLILKNGRIATLWNERPSASAIAIEDGRFLSVGTDYEVMQLERPHTRVIDAAGRTVIPGLNDSHMHPIRARPNYNMAMRVDAATPMSNALATFKG